MSQKLRSGRSGRDEYAEKYRSDLAWEAEWLRLTSFQKVDSIAQLLRRNDAGLGACIEVGAGTGEVIGGLRDRGIGSRHFAVDFSPEAVAALRVARPEVETATADITETLDPFTEGPYDTVIASHVVEHLENPIEFIESLAAVPARWIVIEVPLDDLIVSRIKNRFRDRTMNSAGHVQFFTETSFLLLVRKAGLAVVDTRTYSPKLSAPALKHLARGDSLRVRSLKFITLRAMPGLFGPLFRRFYLGHFTVLCLGRVPGIQSSSG